MKKYQVYQITDSWSSVYNGLSLRTTDKKEAINHALKLKKSFKEVNFNVDTYVNNECIKNEFGRFINSNKIDVYSVIDYTKKKKVKPLKVTPNMFFNEF